MSTPVRPAPSFPCRTPGQRAVTAIAAATLLSLGACSSTESFLSGDKLDYRSQANKTAPLEVPPDLTQLARDGRYRPQGGVVSANDGAARSSAGTATAGAAAPGTAANVALQSAGGVRVERLGTQRWLVVPALAPEQLWPQLQAFWQERGFTLDVQNMEAGVMETNWAENRAKLPQDVVRRTLGGLFENLYSTGERDRFRTRIERGASGGTEVYISHRGMEEVYIDRERSATRWQPRAADNQLEAEMLSRLMVKLSGGKDDAARATVAAAPERPAMAQAVATPGASGLTSVEVADGFERTWRRVGLALDRSGFTVEDRDRAAGLYFVRYVAPGSVEEPGFFSKIFGGAAPQGPARYRVLVKADGAKTRVSVQNSQGAPETGDAAQKIVSMLVNELR